MRLEFKLSEKKFNRNTIEDSPLYGIFVRSVRWILLISGCLISVLKIYMCHWTKYCDLFVYFFVRKKGEKFKYLCWLSTKSSLQLIKLTVPSTDCAILNCSVGPCFIRDGKKFLIWFDFPCALALHLNQYKLIACEVSYLWHAGSNSLRNENLILNITIL